MSAKMDFASAVFKKLYFSKYSVKRLLFSHSKNIQMSTLITIIFLLIISYYSLITKSRNNYCSVGVMELCLLDLLILIDCFLCQFCPCVLFQSLSHVITQESYLWNLGKLYFINFLKFWNLPLFTREFSQFQKSELGKLNPNFPLKHVITSTNFLVQVRLYQVSVLRPLLITMVLEIKC